VNRHRRNFKHLIQCILILAFIVTGVSVIAQPFKYSTPEDDPDDLSVWPNKTSRSNSDAWLAENHDKIRRIAWDRG
jgi:hypothetical protein